jgi:predicted GIY-YIG superfamily endonuclease
MMTKWKPKKKYYVGSDGKRRKIGSWTYVKNPSIRAWARNKEQDILAGVEKNNGISGHVYIFSLGHDNLYKIGCTTNIQQRLKALQASNPNMKCVWSAWVKDMKKVEKQLHNDHKTCRLDREIFTLSHEQITRIGNLVNNLQESY